MIIYNPNKKIFLEIENFLKYYYNEIDLPICIYKSLDIGKHILYNTEQLTRPDVLEFAVSQKKNYDIVEIWDYSESNIELWNSIGIYNTRYVPPKIWPEYQKTILGYNKTNEYLFDIGFCGWVHGDRRVKALSKIAESGLNIKIIDGLYGDSRDSLLANCKILLNIHFDHNYRIFEKIRCFPWLDTGKIVVSENSLDNDPRCVNVKYEDLFETLLGLIK